MLDESVTSLCRPFLPPVFAYIDFTDLVAKSIKTLNESACKETDLCRQQTDSVLVKLQSHIHNLMFLQLLCSGVNEVIRPSPSASGRLNFLKTSERLFKA